MHNDHREATATERALLRIEQRQIITIALLSRIIQMEAREMSDLTQITSKVEKIVGVAESAKEAIVSLAAEVRANATDPAALSALADRLDSEADGLAEAIAANPA